MKITLPEGFELPEMAKPGEAFDVVATLKLCDDGMLELKALDGAEVEEPEEMEDEEESPVSRIRMPWAGEDEGE